MEFDKSRVYSSVNADELRAGDKVIVADDMLTLKAKVLEGFNWYIVAITSILGEEWYGRFDIDKHNFPLAYLVERAENCTNCGEGKWDAEHKKIYCDPVNCGNGNVVFRNQETEVCEYWKPKTKQKTENRCVTCAKSKNGGRGTCVLEESKQVHSDYSLTMPYIWVRTKNAYKAELLITGYEPGRNIITVDNDDCDMEDLFKYFEFLDGSPCGVEE